MKKIKYSHILVIILLLVLSCKQEVIVPQPEPTPDPAAAPIAGTASFTKFVAIGNSFVAGVQGGALFTDGQNNSLPAIMAKQFTLVGGGAFVQPDIKASLGYNLFISPNPGTDLRVQGRLLLVNGTTPDCATGKISPKPTAQKYALGNLEAVPDPSKNPAFLYQGGKANLNNFGVPAITLGQALITGTGNWANPNPAVGFSPFYARLAAPPGGTTTIIGDAAAAGGSFFMMWLGLDDFFLHAAFGGDPAKAPLTSGAAFNVQYNQALTNLLASNSKLQGVIGNFPDIFVMPHFTSVSYNPIPLDAATASAVSTGFAGYNAALDGLVANANAFGISAALITEIGTRKVSFTAGCTNKMLLVDETLTNLGPYFDGLKLAGAITQAQRDALSLYVQVRQSTAADIIPLSTGSVLGTLVNNNPQLISGVTYPLADQYVLIPSEIAAIRAARDAFNSTIAGAAASNTSRVALADVSGAMAELVASSVTGIAMNGVTITANINPPTGIYSEDGVHPNSRGYAWLSTVFIGAINTKFGSTVPLTDISKYSATSLPINP